MRGTLTMAGLAGFLLAGGCSTAGPVRGGSQGEAPALRLWVPPLVHWAAGAERHLDLAIENGTSRTIALAEPDAAGASVAVFPGPDNLRVCGVEGRPGSGERRRVEIPPGGVLSLRVELDEACAGVPAGDYRFEVDYRSPPVEGGKAFTGVLGTRYGELVVEGPPAGKGEATRAGRVPPRRVPQRVNE